LNAHAATLPPEQPPREPPDTPERIATTLADLGWCVADDFMPPLLVSQLRHEAQTHWQNGDFRLAAVGSRADLELRREVRTDRILWLEPGELTGAQRQYWARLDEVRLAVNRIMFLGLHDLEAHFAVYPPGARYRRHLDQFRGVDRRQLSCVLYLNERWRREDGGALRIYTETETETDMDTPARCVDVLPAGGRLVCFLSARFPHQVLPARRERYSIAGWFRRRP
jgi:SM-20-related protein